MRPRPNTLKTLAVACMLALTGSQSFAQNPTMKTVMRDKLVHTERILESLVSADFVVMTRSAGALARISETEIASWQSVPQPEYTKQATAFVLSMQGLREAAAARKIEAALTQYTRLVSSCTRCHAHVRSVRTIPFERPVTR